MARRLFPLAIPLALFAAGRPAGAAIATVLEAPVRVTADSDSAGAPLDAYTPLRVSAQNLEPRAHVVFLRFEGAGAQVNQRLELGPHERRATTLLVPAGAPYGRLHARVGAGESRSEPFSWSWGSHVPALVEGRKAAAPLIEEIRRRAEKAGEAAGESEQAVGEEAAPADSGPVMAVDRDDLPAHLAALAGFHAVALLETPFEQLLEPQRRALEAYAATGGTLLLRQPPARSRELFPLWPAGTPAQSFGYGLGRILLCGSLEVCRRTVSTLPLVVGSPDRPVKAGAGPEKGSRAKRFRGHQPSGALEPLLDYAHVPAGAFLLLVLLFAGVLGPGGLLVRRRFGPTALLVFIPLTAAASCAGIGAYGALREGLFTVHASTRAVTLLDPVHHRAVTAAVHGLYAALAPGSIRFAGQVAPVPLTGASGKLILDQGEGLDFRGGLLPSRSYREVATLSVAPSRARLLVKSENGRVRIQNALGARVLAGVARVEGSDCAFTGIPEGGEAESSCRDGADGPIQPGTLSPRLGERLSDPALAVALAPLAELEFAALLEEAVFAPFGGLRLERENDLQLVRGRAER